MDRKLLTHFNWPILILILTLDTLGLTTVYSAVYKEGMVSLPQLFVSQSIFCAFSILLMLFITIFDYRIYERIAYPLYVFGVLMLSSVLVFGRLISGSRRWFDFKYFSFQPSELCKLFFVIALSKYFHDNAKIDGYRIRDLWKPFLLIFPYLFFIFLSPDLGTTSFYALLFLIIALSVRMNWKSFIIISSIGIMLLPFAYEFLLTDYQRDRIHTLIDPTHDPKGKGYQILQARYAIGSGQLIGNGYLNGTQTHQGFIPENQTDFIITVLGEERGFLGCIFLLSLYYTLLLLCISVSSQSKERFGSILAIGIVGIVFIQIMVNLSAVLGLLPVTGVTLPFMSYGGSFLITLHIAMGLILNISMRRYMF